MSSVTQEVGGPFFEDLHVGQIFDTAPAVTLTEGAAAVHAAILGDRMRLPLDPKLSHRVLGAQLAHPAFAWDMAIGHSTIVTHRVIANLFYRGFVYHRAPCIGDTLFGTTEIVGLRQNRSRPGRAATGLAALRMRPSAQDGRSVLDFFRCAMLPLRDPNGNTGHEDNLDSIGGQLETNAMRASVAGWRLDEFRKAARGIHFADLAPGTVWNIAGGDVVSAAPELARLMLNIAMPHHDAAVGSGVRLVYGGHTIGLAASQATRALPNLVTIVAWHSCDHLGPVREGDTLRSSLELERSDPLPDGGWLVHLRSRVRADRDGGPQDVLDWRFVGVMA